MINYFTIDTFFIRHYNIENSITCIEQHDNYYQRNVVNTC